MNTPQIIHPWVLAVCRHSCFWIYCHLYVCVYILSTTFIGCKLQQLQFLEKFSYERKEWERCRRRSLKVLSVTKEVKVEQHSALFVFFFNFCSVSHFSAPCSEGGGGIQVGERLYINLFALITLKTLDPSAPFSLREPLTQKNSQICKWLKDRLIRNF